MAAPGVTCYDTDQERDVRHPLAGALLDTWNKGCFSGGYMELEFEVAIPPSSVVGRALSLLWVG